MSKIVIEAGPWTLSFEDDCALISNSSSLKLILTGMDLHHRNLLYNWLKPHLMKTVKISIDGQKFSNVCINEMDTQYLFCLTGIRS